MILATHKDHTIRVPDSGGKAGKGRNTTSTVQVLYGRELLKQIRFTVGDEDSLLIAKLRALEFIDSKTSQ